MRIKGTNFNTWCCYCWWWTRFEKKMY